MNYTLKIPASQQNSILLADVAEVMAILAASGYGKSTLHQPSLKNTRQHCTATLLDAAKRGLLIAHDADGVPCTKCLGAEMYLKDILGLTVKANHLQAWGASNGDDFQIEVTA